MIEFVNVTKKYPDLVALDNVNFEIEEGEFIFLVGASGSGKTTIIKLLIRQEDPTEGQIFFYDSDITKIGSEKVSQLRREIGVVFQDFKLLPQKNLFENIAFALEVSGKKREDIEETVSYVLELVDLPHRAQAFPDQISGGEKQKIAIARAVANNPKVLIADEPTGNLDPESSWEIIELLQKINEWGTTVIMATHGSDIVNSLGKRVIELQKGRIITDNRNGYYPNKAKTIALPSQEELNKKKAKKEKKKDTVKVKKRADIEEQIEEKEFEITFTTKANVPADKAKKKKVKRVDDKKKKRSRKKRRRTGKDIVDLYKLELPPKLQEKLILLGYPTIKKLSQGIKRKLHGSNDLSSKEIKKIKKALEKN